MNGLSGKKPGFNLDLKIGDIISINMKKTVNSKLPVKMRPEYDFDYTKARPNRFAGRIDQDQLVVVLDRDISQVFTTPESVKTVLRALITSMKPRKLIDPAQGWFWNKEWQKEEKELDQQIEKGELSPKFRSANEGIKWLKK
jgi:hypothetical protein